MAARHLSAPEIACLEASGCRSGDWNRILIGEVFPPPGSIRDVDFSGDVRLGRFDRPPDGDASRPAGIRNARLHDVAVGDNCRLRRTALSGVDVGDGAIIEDAAEIARTGGSPFGHDSRAGVLAEDGARSVPLWRGLSAQLAHVLCHFRNTPAAKALEGIIRRDVEKRVCSGRCLVGAGCRLTRTGRLIDVRIGDHAVLDGVARLKNCWLEGSAVQPIRLGEGVIAENSIFLAGSEASDRVVLDRCLAGECARLENGLSAAHSLFFANSHFALGEVLAAFAGPFAVSHHKATLVLACQCSFNTFGSAANASNHHFKLGPRHGGVLRRGVNCGSGSYLLWPADIGAFSSVIGRHCRHLDTADFPFSLLAVKGEETILVPGVTVFSAGGIRDAAKWRDRERRRNPADSLDQVNPAILSPYVFQSIDRGVAILRQAAPGDVAHGGATIPACRRAPGMALYETALMYHLGERLLAWAKAAGAGETPGPDAILPLLVGNDGNAEAAEDWSDWGWMLLPGAAGRAFLADVETGRLASPEAALARLRDIHLSYERLERDWLARRWRRECGDPGPASIAVFFERWRLAVLFRRDRLLNDAGKEFRSGAAIGFGVEEPAEAAFARVRGKPEEHPLSETVRRESEALLASAARL